IRHTPAGSRLELSLRRDAGFVEAEMADNGPGIAAADRDKVLRRFHRLEASRTTPGSGLGLALVKAVADLHDAGLELADRDPGAAPPGLRVTLRFPAA
ncbi:MAG TPA: sensor histidine kinase, partial [Alphaproteobacteria bacterium]|nr:sensor histidine kinase [Alphaproteobacteria bacterium]